MASCYVSVIIAAGGSGKRFGNRVKKQFLELEGKPVFYHSLQKFENCSLVSEIIVVLPEDELDYYCKEASHLKSFKKLSKIIPGGKERQDSVYNGFLNVSCRADIVVIHDAARPLISSDIINSTINEAIRHDCALCAVEVKDTVKKADTDNRIRDTIDRTGLWLAQTPQAFRYNVLKEAYEKAITDNFTGTDESALVERIGYKPSIVPGSEYNIKITGPKDMELAKIFLKVINV